eukprot:UN05082
MEYKKGQLAYYQELKHHTNCLSTILNNQKTIDELILYDYLNELPDIINQRITSLAIQHDVEYYKTLYSYCGRPRQHLIKPTQDCIDLSLIGHRGLIDTIVTTN